MRGDRVPAAVVVLVLVVSTVVPATSVVARSGFSDLDEAGSHRPGIEKLAEAGILEGTECAPGEFCPNNPLERWVMAVWMVRVLDGADPDPSPSTRFTDVDRHRWWTPYVERLAMLGVTVGCAIQPARYCPDDPVTRAEMATFLTRAFDLDPAPAVGFSDTAGNTHEPDINALATAGITIGCAKEPARYCPDDPVTRAEMATFLTRALRNAPLQVTIGSSTSRTVNGSFQVEIEFSVPVTGFHTDDITVVNGQPMSLTGSGSTYIATIKPAAEGSVVIWIPEGVASYDTDNPNQESGLLVRTYAPDTHRDGPGFDTWDRDAVARAYLEEFKREEPDPEFTGDAANCEPGTTSQAFRDSIVQRVNWYRQMAGMDTVTERVEYSTVAQHTALIMSAQGDLSHYPGSDWACYTATGATGARRSNLSLGGYGIYAMDSYMIDQGMNNKPVGHRRWILYPRLTEIGTGDIPIYTTSGRTTNALYVLGDNLWVPRPDVREPRGFVAWPPAGYVPSHTMWVRWSFQLEGGDFSQATVKVTDKYGPVPVEVIDRDGAFGDPGIVWTVYHGVSWLAPLPEPVDEYHCYTVTVSDVMKDRATQTPYQYATCQLDVPAPGTN